MDLSGESQNNSLDTQNFNNSNENAGKGHVGSQGSNGKSPTSQPRKRPRVIDLEDSIELVAPSTKRLLETQSETTTERPLTQDFTQSVSASHASSTPEPGSIMIELFENEEDLQRASQNKNNNSTTDEGSPELSQIKDNFWSPLIDNSEIYFDEHKSNTFYGSTPISEKWSQQDSNSSPPRTDSAETPQPTAKSEASSLTHKPGPTANDVSLPPTLIKATQDREIWLQFGEELKRSRFVGLGVLFVDDSSNTRDSYKSMDSSTLSHIAHLPNRNAKGYVICLGSSKSRPFFLPFSDASPIATRQELIDSVIQLIENPAIQKFLFDSKNSLKPLLQEKRALVPQNLFDPQIAAWLYSTKSDQGFAFDLLAQEYLSQSPKPSYTSPFMLLAEDVMTTMQLSSSLLTKLQLEYSDEPNFITDIFENQEMKLPPILALMELDGITFDNEQLVASEKQLVQMLADLQKLANRVCGFEVNLSSPKQMADVLFNKIGLKASKARKTRKLHRFSTTESILRSLIDQHPLPDIIIRYRQVHKFLSNWVTSLNHKKINGKIFSTWNQTGAATGRIISSNPNLQNLPTSALRLDSVLTDRIGSIAMDTVAPSLSPSKSTLPSISVRTAFTASPGNVLVSADYSQLEMRLLAHASQSSTLINFFKEGLDIHRLVASKWKGKPLADITSSERNEAKRLVYGIMYGMGPISLAVHLGVPVEQSKQFHSSFLNSYPEIQTFIQETQLFARTHSYVKTLFGRKRKLDYPQGVHPDHEEQGDDSDGDFSGTMDLDEGSVEDLLPSQKYSKDVKRPDRQAVNSVIQGTAADIMKRAMIRMHHDLRNGFTDTNGNLVAPQPGARLLLQIHDEIIFECPEVALPIVAEIIKRNMESVATLSVPLTCTVRMGIKWGEMSPLSVVARSTNQKSDILAVPDWILNARSGQVASSEPSTTEKQSIAWKGTSVKDDDAQSLFDKL